MDQPLALEIMLSGKNVFLTGAAGSGKTYLLNQFIRASRAEGKKVSVTATTGLAATHLGGNTIHAWSGIGVHDELPKRFFDNLPKGRRDTIAKTDVLIIDEISMLHDFRLDMIDQICQKVRQSDHPFGGLQIILSGDFFQLPPVNRSDSKNGSFVTESQSWRDSDLTICYLLDQFRQEADDYIDILNAMRAGDLRRHHAEKLLSRVNTQIGENTSELHTTNIDVDTINARKLRELPEDEYSYEMSHTGSANYVDNLKRSCLAPETLRLKRGALVMAIKNSQDRKYANGSIGTISDFDSSTSWPIVQFRSGHTVTMSPDTWELRDGDKKRASLSQIPLRLAWAITIHKSQGMTLDGARIDLRRAFVPGMGYVALSRVKSLECLSLVGINRTALQVSPEALRLDANFREQSLQAASSHEHLRPLAAKRSKASAKSAAKSKKSSKSTSWAAKIAKMRETYPNAYMPWTKADDAALKQDFQLGISISKLSKKLGRHEGSIRMRLQKHFGEDVIQ